MRGLVLLGVIAVWIILALFITKFALRSIKSRPIKVLSAALIFAVLLVAPLGDELVGKYQFETLCKKYAVQIIDEQHAMNRRVFFERRSGDQYAKNTAVRIRIDPYVYRDEETKKVTVSFHILTAEGGWLIHALGISETNAPLVFNSGCAPQDAFGFQKSFNITVVN